jgi:hypothetical protein
MIRGGQKIALKDLENNQVPKMADRRFAQDE